jgi:hypothetical protein
LLLLNFQSAPLLLTEDRIEPEVTKNANRHMESKILANRKLHQKTNNSALVEWSAMSLLTPGKKLLRQNWIVRCTAGYQSGFVNEEEIGLSSAL